MGGVIFPVKGLLQLLTDFAFLGNDNLCSPSYFFKYVPSSDSADHIPLGYKPLGYKKLWILRLKYHLILKQFYEASKFSTLKQFKNFYFI